MILVNGQVVNVKKFPNNESYIDMDLSEWHRELFLGDKAKVWFKFEDDSEFLYLKLIKDSLDDINCPAELVMPYIPYSRMDRKENERLFSLKTVASFINSLNFVSVEVWEPHSDVSVALFNKIKVVDKTKLMAQNLMFFLGCKTHNMLNPKSKIDIVYEKCKENNIFLVYPDAGAAKRYNKQFAYDNVITCLKERDFNTGWIKSLKLETPPDKTVDIAIIVDDLCSKGGTFQLTAKALKEQLNVKHIYLVVTHCENTIFDGDVLKEGLIDAVYTTDSIVSDNRGYENLYINEI